MCGAWEHSAMKGAARNEWGIWVWVAVSVMLVFSFLIDVVGWVMASDVMAAFAFFTACLGVLRTPSIWASRFEQRAARLGMWTFAGAFFALAVASVWSSTWMHGARVALDLAGVAVLAALFAVLGQRNKSTP